MPSVTLSSLVGGGGGFIPDTISLTTDIASGVTGTIATITPPSGKRAALLFMQALSSEQTGISVDIGTNNIIPVGTLVNSNSAFIGAGRFSIGANISTSIQMLVAKNKDEPIFIKKNAGNTAQVIRYVFAYGD